MELLICATTRDFCAVHWFNCLLHTVAVLNLNMINDVIPILPLHWAATVEHHPDEQSAFKLQYVSTEQLALTAHEAK